MRIAIGITIFTQIQNKVFFPYSAWKKRPLFLGLSTRQGDGGGGGFCEWVGARVRTIAVTCPLFSPAWLPCSLCLPSLPHHLLAVRHGFASIPSQGMEHVVALAPVQPLSRQWWHLQPWDAEAAASATASAWPGCQQTPEGGSWWYRCCGREEQSRCQGDRWWKG